MAARRDRRQQTAPASSSVFALEGEAQASPTACPSCLLDALRVANTVAHGIHGRRRAGTGETFWQFRQFQASDPAAVIDWRRSASSDTPLCARARVGGGAHLLALAGRLAFHGFRSHLAPISKRDRAVVLTLAMAELLVRAGERIALMGLTPPMASRKASLAHRRDAGDARGRRRRAEEPAAAGASVALLQRAAVRRFPRSAGAPSPRASTRWPRAASPATSCRSSIPPRRPWPTRAASSSARPRAASAGSRTAWRRCGRATRRKLAAHRAQHRGGRAPHRLVVPGASHRPARRRAAADPDHASAGHGQRLPLEAGCAAAARGRTHDARARLPS